MGKIHSFDEDDAIKYGQTEAVLLHHIRWWVAKNKANEKHTHDGRAWTYNSRKAFALLFPFLSEHQIYRALDKLVEAGALVKGNYNPSSYDRTTWYALGEEVVSSHCANLHNRSRDNAQPIPVVRPVVKEKEIKTPPSQPMGGEDCFGLAKTIEGNATEFDRTIAAMLESAVRTLPARQTGIAQARPSTWADHIRLLRNQDGYTEEDIKKTTAWYAAHIGNDFVPEAYSGTAFRRKFATLLHRAEHDLFTVTVGPAASEIVARLHAEEWPPVCRAQLVATTQICLTSYKKWIIARNNYLDNGAAKETPKLYSFGRHLQSVMPPPSYFVQAWLETVRKRVVGWKEWEGDLRPFLFKPGAKEFVRMGRTWAENYCGDAAVWDAFCRKIDTENKIDEN